MKVDIETVADALTQEGINPAQIKAVVDRLEQVVADEKEAREAEKEKAPKFEPVAIVTDMRSMVDLNEAPIFIIEHVDSMNHVDACKLFSDLVVQHNVDLLARGKKTKKKVIETIGDAVQYLPRKTIKEAGLRVRYKEPVIAQQRENQIKMPTVQTGAGTGSDEEA